MHSKPMIPSRLYILKLLFFVLSFQLEPILSVKIDASSAIDILTESHNSYPTQTYRGDANTWFPSKPPLDTNEMVTRFQKASKRVLVLDVDGTMIKFHTDINQAVPTDDLKKALSSLNEHANTHVSILSGRRQADLKTHFNRYNNFKLSAEHGGFVRNPNGEWHSPVEVDSSWMSQAFTIMQRSTELVEQSHVESKKFGLVWHYSAAPNMEAAVAEAHELYGRLRKEFNTNALKVRHGSFIVEILPSIMQKGNIAADTWKEHSDADFVLCLGDDTTDEDMFESLLKLSGKEGFSPDVLYTTIVNYSRRHPSFAKSQIPSVDEVIKLLGALADSDQTIVN